ncbi:hypothetical protein MSAN_00634000 [Mycena sanguinolenta]|uniref:Uncharacterized protein n=1 Tax=Mycena sanguinolenta TaxID=230812 RepID=A0A8H6Z6A6_9AGAR|nr:hypothetical protein MSAN_00634000 [Mycena sanguinolenta]
MCGNWASDEWASDDCSPYRLGYTTYTSTRLGTSCRRSCFFASPLLPVYAARPSSLPTDGEVELRTQKESDTSCFLYTPTSCTGTEPSVDARRPCGAGERIAVWVVNGRETGWGGFPHIPGASVFGLRRPVNTWVASGAAGVGCSARTDSRVVHWRYVALDRARSTGRGEEYAFRILNCISVYLRLTLFLLVAPCHRLRPGDVRCPPDRRLRRDLLQYARSRVPHDPCACLDTSSAPLPYRTDLEQAPSTVHVNALSRSRLGFDWPRPPRSPPPLPEAKWNIDQLGG